MTATLVRPRPARDTRPGAILAVVLTAQFMAMLDVSVVNVATATIRAALDASGAGLQLVVAGYTISYAVLLVSGARLGDRFGHGRVFRAGLVGFTAASLLCGLAPGTAPLIVFRVLQGVGAAAMMPQVMSLIQRTFSGAERARALGFYSVVVAGGSVVGQVLGGLLVSADVLGTGWRPVFLINVPIGVVLLVFARRVLPRETGDPTRRFDPLGVLTLSAAVLLLVVPLVLGHEEHWPAWCWASMAASAAASGVFAVVERRAAAPLVPASVARAPGLRVAVLVLLLQMVGYAGFLFTMALHLQSGLGAAPARAGLIFAPMAVGFAATGTTWQRLPERWHARAIPIGLAFAAAGCAGLAAALRGGAPVGWSAQAALVLIGLSLGAGFSPMISTALRHVPPAEAAHASGVLVTTFQLGQVIGVATLGTLYLTLVHRPGAVASAHAFTTAALVLVGVFAAASALSVRTARATAGPGPLR